ncbi:MAG: PH domain-containing protein [Treponema sp.]|jgi:membrane protein YdbS with pleckstrin-like domain|nr:PH domain-containing protein [Treponema sp.]
MNKRSRGESEFLIYKPEMHGLVLARPFFALMASFVLWLFFFIAQLFAIGADVLRYAKTILAGASIVSAVFAGLYFVWQIFEYLSVIYYITNKRLVARRGFFSSVTVEMPIEKIEGLICYQGAPGKLFKYGTVLVSGVGGMLLRFSAVKSPERVAKIIDAVLEKNKRIIVGRGDKPRAITVSTGSVKDIEYGAYITSYPVGEMNGKDKANKK